MLEQQRILDGEKREQETQALLCYLERLQEEDLQQVQKKREAWRALMEEVAKCNEVGKNSSIGDGTDTRLV